MPNHSSRLMPLMFLIGRRMREGMNRHAAAGCSWLHLEALRFAEEAGLPTMRDMARHFRMTPPAATLLVDGLVANKMLRRFVDTRDRRAIRASLTPKGKRALKAGIALRKKQMKKLFSVLNPGEYSELVRILEKVARST